MAPYIQGVPVCSNYCDSWFEACKNDSTCFDNFEEAYINASGMPNNCRSSQCRTFREIFVNSKGLCDRLWGPVYKYSTDLNNCTVMEFDSGMPNPNTKLTFPSSGSLSTLVLGSDVIQVSAKLLYLLLTVVAVSY